MDLTIRINMDNAAFDESRGDEVERILREVSRLLPNPGLGDEVTLRDINGNTVGNAEVTT